MFSWSQKRQFRVIVVVLFAAAAFFAMSVFVAWYRAPNCFDKKQNGEERGTDCGGSCALLCANEAIAPLVHFVRALPVGEGVWNVVAYVENKNPNAGALRAPYVFKLYDAGNLLVYERHGEAFVPPGKAFPVVAGGLRIDEREPTRAAFEFTVPPRFVAMEESPRLEIRRQTFSEEEGVSRLEAELHNPTLAVVHNIEASVLLYDSGGNVFAAAQTVIQEIAPRGAVPLRFSWQRVFPEAPARREVFYQVPPQN